MSRAESHPRDPIIDSLITLRDRFCTEIVELERRLNHAREQLEYTEALLLNQLAQQHQQTQGVLGTALPLLESERLIASAEQTSVGAGEPQQVEHSAGIPAGEGVLDTPPAAKPTPRSRKKSHPTSSTLATPLLPDYAGLTKTEAIQKLMQANPGVVFHVDYLVRVLHGQLDEVILKQERSRMQQSLYKGTRKGLWEKVPDQERCYTLSLHLVDPELGMKQ